MKPKLIEVALGLALLALATTTHAQTVETGIVKLADSNIQYCMAYCDGDETSAQILLRFAMRQAELLVEERWTQIHKLAFALLEHEKVSGPQTAKILNGEMP